MSVPELTMLSPGLPWRLLHLPDEPTFLAAALLLGFSACGDATAPVTITSVAFDTDAPVRLVEQAARR